MCAFFYLGDTDEAEVEVMRSGKALSASVPKPVRKSVEANMALVGLLTFLRAHPVATRTEGEHCQTWDDVPEQLAAKPQLARMVRTMVEGRPLEPMVSESKVTGEGRSELLQRELPSIPLFEPALGVCPPGWDLALQLPSTEAARQTGTVTGVSVCEREVANGPERLVHLRLAADSRPPGPAVQVVALFLEYVPAGLAAFDLWSKGCALVERRGTSDLGEVMYQATCIPWATTVVVFVGDGGKVVRVVQIDHDEEPK